MVYQSPLPSIEIPNLSLTDHIFGPDAACCKKTALMDALTGKRTTYAGLFASITAGAIGLSRLGIQLGDVVALMSHNQAKLIVAVHAALKAGAVVTLLNPGLSEDEICKQLMRCGAKTLIVSEDIASKARVSANACGIQRLFVLGQREGLTPFSKLLLYKQSTKLPVFDPATTLALLPFSSGTSGEPKPVMLTHRNLVANIQQTHAGWRLTEHDVQVAALPFYHAYGFTIVLHAGLLARSTIITIPRFEINQYLDAVAGNGATVGYVVPSIVRLISEVPGVEARDFSALKYLVCGGAPFDLNSSQLAASRLGCVIGQGYGLTEASPGTHQVFDEELDIAPPGSVGRLSANTEARVIQLGTNIDVTQGTVGELLIRGPQVMAGYLNAPEATADSFTDGWLRTGDLAQVDDKGFFWIQDRLKDIIKYKGYQISPAELESLLCSHPAVTEAAVIGIPHDLGGEAPKAFVVTREVIEADELMAWVAKRVASYKKIRCLEFIAAIPRSPTGKVLRRALR